MELASIPRAVPRRRGRTLVFRSAVGLCIGGILIVTFLQLVNILDHGHDVEDEDGEP